MSNGVHDARTSRTSVTSSVSPSASRMALTALRDPSPDRSNDHDHDGDGDDHRHRHPASSGSERPAAEPRSSTSPSSAAAVLIPLPPKSKRRKVQPMRLSVQTDPAVLHRPRSESTLAPPLATPHQQRRVSPSYHHLGPTSAPAVSAPWRTSAPTHRTHLVPPRYSAPRSQEQLPSLRSLGVASLPPLRRPSVPGSGLPAPLQHAHRRTASHGLLPSPLAHSPQYASGPRSAEPFSLSGYGGHHHGHSPAFDWSHAHLQTRTAHPSTRAPASYAPWDERSAPHSAFPLPGRYYPSHPPLASRRGAPTPQRVTNTPPPQKERSPHASTVEVRRRTTSPNTQDRWMNLIILQSLTTGSSQSHIVLVDTDSKERSTLHVLKLSRRSSSRPPTEYSILSALDHPSIIRVYGEFNASVYGALVLEYVPGSTLYTALVRNQPVPATTVKFYVGGVLLALEYLHSRSIVHGNIKPEHVLIGIDGYIKLAGFGQAQVVPRTSDQEDVEDEWHQLSPSGHLPETRDEYTPPEVWREDPYTMAVDLWQVGILLYELLAGYTPFAPAQQPRAAPTYGGCSTASPWSETGSYPSAEGPSSGSSSVSAASRAPWASRPARLASVSTTEEEKEREVRNNVLRGIQALDVVKAILPAFTSMTSSSGGPQATNPNLTPTTATSPVAGQQVKHVTHLLVGLLNSSAVLRLGNGNGGILDVKRHIWFGTQGTATPIEPIAQNIWSTPTTPATAPTEHRPKLELPRRREDDWPEDDFDWNRLATHQLRAPYNPPAPPTPPPVQGAPALADWFAAQPN